MQQLVDGMNHKSIARGPDRVTDSDAAAVDGPTPRRLPDAAGWPAVRVRGERTQPNQFCAATSGEIDI